MRSPRLITSPTSRSSLGLNSWLYRSPTRTLAFMAIPGWAPETPASQSVAALISRPWAYSRLFSPNCQTLPSASWAYQSKVSSTSWPSTAVLSRTTTHSTPMTSRVADVTSTTLRTVCPPSPVPSYTQRFPGFRGR